MANHKGIDVVASTERVVQSFALKDSAGAKITTGTATLRILEERDDGSTWGYDFNDHTFKSTTATTPTTTISHQTANGGAYNTGVWTFVETNVAGWTLGSIYIFQLSHSSAFPAEQERKIQFGSAEGDMQVTAGNIHSDVRAMANAVITAAVIATDAIDADAIAASAVTEIQTGLAVPGSLMGLADGAITAAKFAANAIDSTALAASAVTEIQTGLAVPGSPMTLADGAITNTKIANNAITAASVASDVGDEIAAAVRTNLAVELANIVAIFAVAEKYDTMVEIDGPNFRFTVGSLFNAPTGGGGGGIDPSYVVEVAHMESGDIPITYAMLQRAMLALICGDRMKVGDNEWLLMSTDGTKERARGIALQNGGFNITEVDLS